VRDILGSQLATPSERNTSHTPDRAPDDDNDVRRGWIPAQAVRHGIFGTMSSSGLKQKMVETVEHLPDDATVEDAMERLYFLAKVERGLEQSQTGQTVSHEDVKKRFVR
jgi:hypothetical protein